MGNKTKLPSATTVRENTRIILAAARKAALVLAVPAAVAGFVLGSTGTASATVTSSPQYSENLAGYAGVNNGMKAFNDIRGNAVVPDEPSTVPADTVAVGVILQEFSNVASPTVGLGLVWDDTAHPGTCADGGQETDQWTLEEGLDSTGAPGVPLDPSQLAPIPDGTKLFCVPAGQQYYLEIHDSTLLNKIAFAAGSVEPGNTLGFTGLSMFGPNVRFYNFGVGVDTTLGSDASDLSPGTLASFTRDGLTQLLSPKLKAGGTNDRLTINAENLQEYIGTQDGTSSGAVTLQPSGLGTGSSFTVTATV